MQKETLTSIDLFYLQRGHSKQIRPELSLRSNAQRLGNLGLSLLVLWLTRGHNKAHHHLERAKHVLHSFETYSVQLRHIPEHQNPHKTIVPRIAELLAVHQIGCVTARVPWCWVHARTQRQLIRKEELPAAMPPRPWPQLLQVQTQGHYRPLGRGWGGTLLGDH